MDLGKTGLEIRNNERLSHPQDAGYVGGLASS